MISIQKALGGDGISDCLRNPSSASTSPKEQKVVKDYFKRLALTTSQDTQDRFIDSLEAFFEGLEKQAKDRLVGKVPSLATYIDLRRDTSGCRPCFVLIEYANNLRLPSGIMRDAIIQQLGDYTNDLVAWSNDLFSFKVETRRKDTHNGNFFNMTGNGSNFAVMPDNTVFLPNAHACSGDSFMKLIPDAASLNDLHQRLWVETVLLGWELEGSGH
ncbi:isoprenoid synthase domain-containing protein [Mycena olivaceomarginata]|nr:isoprenoid synthase domain-containing protein [Mycena olivaceomarginata]